MIWFVIYKNLLSKKQIEELKNSPVLESSYFEESEKYISADIWNFDMWEELLEKLHINEENVFYVKD